MKVHLFMDGFSENLTYNDKKYRWNWRSTARMRKQKNDIIVSINKQIYYYEEVL